MVENSFGIPNNKWRVLLLTKQQEPELLATITMVYCDPDNIVGIKYGHLAVDEYMEELQLYEDDCALARMNPSTKAKTRGMCWSCILMRGQYHGSKTEIEAKSCEGL